MCTHCMHAKTGTKNETTENETDRKIKRMLWRKKDPVQSSSSTALKNSLILV